MGGGHHNACLSWASKCGGEGSASTLAVRYEEAKAKAEQSFCCLKHNLSNERLLLRYVRALRRCERMKTRLLAYVSPAPSIPTQPEPELPDA